MPINLADKIKPANNRNFPIADAEDIAMPDGKRLSNALPVPLTQEEYNQLVKSGNIDATTIYVIYDPDKHIVIEGSDDG